MKSYIVVGLGRFGSSVAEMLCRLGNEVLALDTQEDLVQKISSNVTTAVIADARDLEALRALDAGSFDCGVVAMGSDLATAVLTVLNLKELGVPYVVCKARDEMQKRALEKIGADQVMIPEREMGDKLAQRLSSANILDYIDLSEDYGIAETTVKLEWLGKSLAELGIRSKYGLNVIAVRRDGEIMVSPAGDFRFQPEDIVVVLGQNTDLSRVSKL